jgi:WD40 repeat protein
MKSFWLIIATLSLAISACSPTSGQVADAVSTALAEAAALTALAPAAPAEEPASPTAPAPSPTAVPPVISPINMSSLAIQMSFGQTETPRSLAFTPDGSVLVSAGGNTADFNIRVWDVGSGELLQTLSGHTGIVWMVAVSPDGKLLASGSNDQTVKVWDWTTGELLQSLDFPYSPVSVRFSPDGQILAVGGGDGNSFAFVWLVSTVTWEEQQVLAEYWNIPDIAFSPDGQTIAAGGTSRNVRVWRTSDGVEEHVLFHPGQVSSLAISPDGSTLATGLCEESDANLQCTLGAVWLWDLDSGTVIKKLSDFTDWVTDLAYSPDGALIYAGARGGRMIVYDSSNYQLVPFSVPNGVDALAVSPDGRLLATAGYGGIDLWSVGP